MAHNIGKMFYFGERPWHKLGTKLDKPASLEEALSAGGLDWTVGMQPLVLAGEHQSAVPQRQAIVRDDVLPGQPGRVLGAVHPNFKVLQNRDGAALFDSLFGSKGAEVYHTGGYLKKGEVVWLMAKLPDSIILPGEDSLDTYLLFSNSHDGTLPIDIRLTTVRVVCNNTLTLALRKKDQAHVFRRGHSGNYEVIKTEAEAFFKSVLAQQNETQAVMEKLVQAKCSDDAFAAFLKLLLPDPTRPATADANRAVERGFDTRTATIGWRQLPWPVDDNYLGGFDASTGQVWEAGYGEPIELKRRLTFCPAKRLRTTKCKSTNNTARSSRRSLPRPRPA